MNSANLLSLVICRSAYWYPNCSAMKASRARRFHDHPETVIRTGSPLAISRSMFRTCPLFTSAPVPHSPYSLPSRHVHGGDGGDRRLEDEKTYTDQGQTEDGVVPEEPRGDESERGSLWSVLEAGLDTGVDLPCVEGERQAEDDCHRVEDQWPVVAVPYGLQHVASLGASSEDLPTGADLGQVVRRPTGGE